MTERILRVQNLQREFGGLVAVNDVSFEVTTGERIALIGPNGAGKTTCFNMLGGSLAPSGGSIHFLGDDVTALPPHRRAALGIGRTFQIAAVFRSMTVRENVATACMAADMDPKEAEPILADAGILTVADDPITELSYGDVKRVELAMALATNPKLLLLDEPTAGTAGGERTRMMRLVGNLAAKHGTTVLFVEHDMDTVFGFATRILVMNQGCLIADGAPDEVRSDPAVQAVYLGTEADNDA